MTEAPTPTAHAVADACLDLLGVIEDCSRTPGQEEAVLDYARSVADFRAVRSAARQGVDYPGARDELTAAELAVVLVHVDALLGMLARELAVAHDLAYDLAQPEEDA